MFADLLARVTALLPEGRQLPGAVWRRRHAVIVRIAAAQAVALGVLALFLGRSLLTALTVVVLTLMPLPVALPAEFSRKVRAAATTVSLLVACVLLVHLMAGVTESHFSFFLLVGVVSLYQDWVPFGVAAQGFLLARPQPAGEQQPGRLPAAVHA